MIACPSCHVGCQSPHCSSRTCNWRLCTSCELVLSVAPDGSVRAMTAKARG